MMDLVGPDEYKRLATRFHKLLKGDPTSPDIVEAAGVALLHYTGRGFEQLNAALRSELPPSRALMIQSTLMCEALEEFPRWEGQVFRSERSWPGMWEWYKMGRTISVSSFYSTSYDHAAVFDGNITIIIDHVMGRVLNPYSVKPNEREVLFCPGTTFYVRAIENLAGKSIIYLGEE